jgi:hypothetical protein
MSNLAKILGDHHFNDFIKDVKVADLLGMPYAFKYVTTVSSLGLEMDPQGTETILLIGCMHSILDSIYLDETGREMELLFDKLRVMFDSYFMKSSHLVYLCPPIGRPSTRVTTQYQEVLSKFRVGEVLR